MELSSRSGPVPAPRNQAQIKRKFRLSLSETSLLLPRAQTPRPYLQRAGNQRVLVRSGLVLLYHRVTEEAWNSVMFPIGRNITGSSHTLIEGADEGAEQGRQPAPRVLA